MAAAATVNASVSKKSLGGGHRRNDIIGWIRWRRNSSAAAAAATETGGSATETETNRDGDEAGVSKVATGHGCCGSATATKRPPGHSNSRSALCSVCSVPERLDHNQHRIHVHVLQQMCATWWEKSSQNTHTHVCVCVCV